MAASADQFTRRRLRSSYISVVISISLVLLVLGIFGLLLVNAGTIATHVRENFSFTILLNDDAPEASVRQFQKSLELKPYVKSTEYISKEEAAAQLRESIEEDFVEFLGYNPLLNAIEIHLRANYANEEQLAYLESEFTQMDIVREVVYDKSLIQLVNKNIERIGLFLLAGCILLTLIAVGLINSSIRLSIYSRRFLIKTMQLVGATKSFIRKPFIWRSFRHGLYGALIAIALMVILLYYADQQIPYLFLMELQNVQWLIILFAGVLVMGIFISMSCTFFALKKYLKLKTDQLYF